LAAGDAALRLAIGYSHRSLAPPNHWQPELTATFFWSAFAFSELTTCDGEKYFAINFTQNTLYRTNGKRRWSCKCSHPAVTLRNVQCNV